MAVNAPKVVILSHGAWTREFGGDRSVVGRMVTLNDESVQVIGVLAADAYTFPRMGADILTKVERPWPRRCGMKNANPLAR